jgi:hypothetical protein
MTTYSPATTGDITVDVEVPVVVCQLTGVANLSMADVSEPFTISGMLTAADGSIPTGQTIQLNAKATDGTYTPIDGATALTDETGAYSISLSESAAGLYAFQGAYAGGEV